MIRIVSMFSDNYNVSKEVLASAGIDTWQEVLTRIMAPSPPPQRHLCRVYVANHAHATLVEMPSHKWDKVVVRNDASLVVLHYPKYANLAYNDALPQYEDLQQTARARCRRVAVLLIGTHKLRRSALLATNNRDAIGVLARAVWQTRDDVTWMRAHKSPRKKLKFA